VSAAKQPTPAQLRRKQQTRVKDIVKSYAGNDPFGGLGDWDPAEAPKTAIARVIAHLAGMKIAKPKPAVAKEKTVKRAPKPKAPPKPKKGKKVGKVNEVCLKSPYTRETQWLPLVAELSELLAEGWEIVDGDVPVNAAYEFLNFNPEVQGA
jgi:hypothetical protein